MSAKRKHRPNWDDGFFMARADPECKPAPRLESERPAELDEPFSFDFEAIRKAWASVGVVANKSRIILHTWDLLECGRRLKK